MTTSGLGQHLSTFSIELGNCAPDLVCLYALIGAVIFVGSVAVVIRKQIKGRRILYGFSILAVCVFINPLGFLSYGEFYQTIFLLLWAPLTLVELNWRTLFTPADLALLNVPLWHWSLVYWVGCLNEA